MEADGGAGHLCIQLTPASAPAPAPAPAHIYRFHLTVDATGPPDLLPVLLDPIHRTCDWCLWIFAHLVPLVQLFTLHQGLELARSGF